MLWSERASVRRQPVAAPEARRRRRGVTAPSGVDARLSWRPYSDVSVVPDVILTSRNILVYNVCSQINVLHYKSLTGIGHYLNTDRLLPAHARYEGLVEYEFCCKRMLFRYQRRRRVTTASETVTSRATVRAVSSHPSEPTRPPGDDRRVAPTPWRRCWRLRSRSPCVRSRCVA